MTQNSSFVRTEKAITNAFMELLQEKPFEKITVQDILDKTPVTRATFYAHFHDKYEIAEKMQEHFLSVCDSVRTDLIGLSPAQYYNYVTKMFASKRKLTEALLKIRTEKVDIQRAIATKFEQYYKNTLNPSATPTEAYIYGLIRAELELAVLYDESILSSFQANTETILSIALNLLRLSDDSEVWEFMKKKLDEKFAMK